MIIKEIILLTNDIAAAENFYAKKSELAVVHKFDTHISFSAGNSILINTHLPGYT